MSNVTISQLTAGSALTGVEPFPMVQGGNTLKATAAQIATYVLANPVATGTITITQIATPASNTNLTITPNGTGGVYMNTSLVRVGSGSATATIGSNGAQDLVITSNLGAANQGTITIADGANGDISIAPNGTGALNLSTATLSVGTGAANATFSSIGAYDLIIRTNAGAANQAVITLADGANGNITIAPDGTGQILASKAVVVTGLISSTSTILSTAPTGGVGYATGAGGTITQATSKATPATLSKVCGTITTAADALAAATTVSFVLTNTAIAAGDVMIINHLSGGTVGSYTFNAQCIAGSATINIRNVTAAPLSEALTLAFVVVKAVTA